MTSESRRFQDIEHEDKEHAEPSETKAEDFQGYHEELAGVSLGLKPDEINEDVETPNLPRANSFSEERREPAVSKDPAEMRQTKTVHCIKLMFLGQAHDYHLVNDFLI